MLSITVQGETLADVSTKLKNILFEMSGFPLPPAELTATAATAQPEAKKRGRGKAKVETTEPESVASENPATTASDLSSIEVTELPIEITKERVLELLQQVSKTKSFAVAQTILKKYGGNRVSDIPKEKWASIVDDCAANLA